MMRVEADSSLQHFSGDPCAVFARNVGLDLSTRVEVTGSVLILIKRMERSMLSVHGIPQLHEPWVARLFGKTIVKVLEA